MVLFLLAVVLFLLAVVLFGLFLLAVPCRGGLYYNLCPKYPQALLFWPTSPNGALLHWEMLKEPKSNFRVWIESFWAKSANHSQIVAWCGAFLETSRFSLLA